LTVTLSWLQRLAAAPRRRVVVAAVLAAFAGFIVAVLLVRLVEGAVNLATGFGILDLEFAWTAARAGVILTAWGPTLTTLEVWGVDIDFGFIASYATLMAGLTLLLARQFAGRVQTLGFLFVLAPVIAGFFDVTENALLLTMMSAPMSVVDPVPLVASLCATIKFALIIGTILYFFIGLGVFAVRRAR